MYGYIYKTTNLLNGKIYIGKKKGKFTENYKGSGKYLKNSINKYGEENFKVEVIEYCETLEEQNKKEKYWITYYKNQNAEIYNIADGGDGGDIFSCLPEEQLQNIKDYISYCSKNGICGVKGTHLSMQAKQNHSKSMIGKNKGKIWITNGTNCKHILPEELEKYISLGYKRGRKVTNKEFTAWNKGLTKDDSRVAKYCRKPGTYNHSEETRRKISENRKGKGIKIRKENINEQ